jgi:hypothetical protein
LIECKAARYRSERGPCKDHSNEIFRAFLYHFNFSILDKYSVHAKWAWFDRKPTSRQQLYHIKPNFIRMVSANLLFLSTRISEKKLFQNNFRQKVNSRQNYKILQEILEYVVHCNILTTKMWLIPITHAKWAWFDRKPTSRQQLYHIKPNFIRMVFAWSSFRSVSNSLAFNQPLQKI